MAFQGHLSLILGPMCSGKSTELLRRLFVESVCTHRILYVNHKYDVRTEEGSSYSTHNPLYQKKLKEQSHVTFLMTKRLQDVNIDNYDIIGIDEGQFFPDIRFAKDWADSGKTVIVAALNGDFQRNKFGNISELLPFVNELDLKKSICKNCAANGVRSEGIFSKRLVNESSQVLAGGSDMYMPVCRKCYLGIP